MQDNNGQRIGEKIRIERLKKNYSQEYMAFMLDISQAAYSNLEADKVEITVIRAFEIAEILQISAYDILPKPKFGTIVDFIRFRAMIRSFRRKLKKRALSAEGKSVIKGTNENASGNNL